MNKVLAFIGAGNMGGALAKSICSKTGGDNVVIFDPDTRRMDSLAVETHCRRAVSAQEAVRQADYVFLCVKPHMVSAVLGQLAEALTENKRRILVSIAAGVSIHDLQTALGPGGETFPTVRLLPNTPVTVGRGMTVMSCSSQVSQDEKELLIEYLSAGGDVMDMEEGLIDKTTAIFSSSPAFTCMFLDALADGGVLCGVPRDMALRLAAQAVLGTAAMVLETGEHPSSLKDRVCSPGGSTIEGVRALEDGGLRSSVISAVDKTYQKTLKLGKK